RFGGDWGELLRVDAGDGRRRGKKATRIGGAQDQGLRPTGVVDCVSAWLRRGGLPITGGRGPELREGAPQGTEQTSRRGGRWLARRRLGRRRLSGGWLSGGRGNRRWGCLGLLRPSRGHQSND